MDPKQERRARMANSIGSFWLVTKAFWVSVLSLKKYFDDLETGKLGSPDKI